MTGHDADGHTVDVARRRGARDVEVRVRIEPEHRQRSPPRRAVARDGRHRADRNAVVAAHQERNLAGFEARVDGVVHAPTPSRDLGQMAVVTGTRLLWVTGTGDVAAVDDCAPQPAQGLVETRDPQGFGPHRPAPTPGADIGRRPDQRHGCGLPVSRRHRPSVACGSSHLNRARPTRTAVVFGVGGGPWPRSKCIGHDSAATGLCLLAAHRCAVRRIRATRSHATTTHAQQHRGAGHRDAGAWRRVRQGADRPVDNAELPV